MPDEVRAWLACSTFGWTVTEFDEQPVARVDWLLAVELTHREVEAEARRKAERGR